MRVFFGKISKSGREEEFFDKQIKEKRYYSRKDSPWFGEIREDDYCYIIAGDKIYLWQAKKFENDYLQFEAIFEEELPINGNQFRSMKFFEFTPQIIVLTTRKARNRAFFEIKYTQEFTEDVLKNKNTYNNENNFRKIILADQSSTFNDEDIFLIKSNEAYSLYKSQFIPEKTFNAFIDNTHFSGKSGKKRSNKDSTIEKIKKSSIGEEIQDVSLLSFYDLFFNEYKIKEIDSNEDEEIEVDEKGEIKVPSDKQPQPLNQILYGPPGTGKTYHTINKALEIIFDNEKNQNEKIKYEVEIDKKKYEVEKSYIEVLQLDENERRRHLKGLFEYFKDEKRGQIEFVTFHQSYGYEEFVEGIKAISPDDERNSTNSLIYKVEDGIFKRLSNNAKPIKAQPSNINFDWDNGNIFKMSLGGKNETDILDWCLENNYVSMGWGDDIDFSDVTAQNWEDFKKQSTPLLKDAEADKFVLQVMYAFKVWMKQNDLVFISSGNLRVIAIGQIVGDYEYKDSMDGMRYSQFRKVKWLFIDKSGIPVEKILNKRLSQQTIYNLEKSYVKRDFFDSLFKEATQSEEKNYVLIIDEINRGNISKIFGELITLIEKSKRIGKDEAISIKLPYSNESFSVPSNLYIIGTMNTADRSIAPIDTALRRRFVFEEMSPKPKLLNNNCEGVDLQQLLESINTRIEYLYDRDHTIGHAYLIDVKTLDDLKFSFKNKIIPLLAEYFYEDWENIKKVLNDKENKFVKSKEKNSHPALSDIENINSKKIYEVCDLSKLEEQDFIKIYPQEKELYTAETDDKTE